MIAGGKGGHPERQFATAVLLHDKPKFLPLFPHNVFTAALQLERQRTAGAGPNSGPNHVAFNWATSSRIGG